MNVVQRAILRLERRNWFNHMSDEHYLRWIYFVRTGKWLNLKKPKTYNEKLQWLKLYDRNPEYTRMVDKYEAKGYAQERIGQQYIIPTYGVWDHFDEIDFDSLPDRFVLKCTHDSGSLVICRDKKKLNYGRAKAKLERCLQRNFYLHGREWPYRDVKPRILAEKYIEDPNGEGLPDYKFFCFSGEVKAMFVATDRYTKGVETKFDFFDAAYNHLPFTQGHPNAQDLPEKPATFEEMKSLAEKLSQGIPQVRVDFYEVDGKVYFGEMTFFHYGGWEPFRPGEWDRKFGQWIDLQQANLS